MICFSKLLFAVTDFASLSLDYWTRSLRLATCKGPTVIPGLQLQRTYVWQKQNDDGPLSGVGSYVSDFLH